MNFNWWWFIFRSSAKNGISPKSRRKSLWIVIFGSTKQFYVSFLFTLFQFWIKSNQWFCFVHSHEEDEPLITEFIRETIQPDENQKNFTIDTIGDGPLNLNYTLFENYAGNAQLSANHLKDEIRNIHDMQVYSMRKRKSNELLLFKWHFYTTLCLLYRRHDKYSK